METASLILQGIKAGVRDWKRSAWLIIGITLGLSFYVAIASIGASYTELVQLPFSRIESDLLIQQGTRGKSQSVPSTTSIKLPFSNQAITREAIQAIVGIEGIKQLDAAILLWHQERKNFTTITGIDITNSASGPARVLQWISKGRTLQNSGEAVVESHYARFHKIKPGATISLGQQQFRVVGITKIKEGAVLAAANFYISLDDARSLSAMEEGSANLLSATLNKGTDKQVIKKKITSQLPGSIVSSSDSIGEMMQGFAKISASTSHLLSIIALVFTILFACWLITGRQQEQRWQIGLMKTLGWRRRDILLRSGAEVLTIGVIGATAGIILGLLFSSALGSMEVTLTLPWNLAPNPEGMMSQVVAGKGDITVPLPMVLQPLTLLYGFTATCAGVVATGLLTSYYISGLEIRKTLFEQ